LIKLTDQIELDGLTENQLSNILGELTASVAHLTIHSESIKEVKVTLAVVSLMVDL